MRNRGPWVPIALLAVGVAALTIVVIALAAGGDEDDEAGATTQETVVVVTEAEPETTTVTATEDESVSVVVPEVTRLDYIAASETAEDAGLIADSYPVESDARAGTVVSQEPAAGSEVAPTRRLRLNVSAGPGDRATLRVPDVTGPKAPRARRIAWEQGFLTLTADRDAPTAEEVDEVILQEPAAGTQAPALTQITLFVGR